MKKGRILVIRGGAIGDFILTVPALAALRGQFPDAHLAVLGYPHIASLAQAAGLVDEVRPIEARALAGFFARNGDLDKALSEYLAGFAIIISCLYDPDEIFKTNVARCHSAQFIPGPHRPDDHSQLHATGVFLRPLEKLAIFDADPVPRLRIPSRMVPELAQGRWLAIHPGSGSERKNWAEARWRELLERIVQGSDINVLLVGGEAEGERLQRLGAGLPANRRFLAQSLPLPALASWLPHCLGFIGHDSGITHLAAAQGLRVLALWGETNEAVWRPLGENIRLVREPGGLEALTVDQVLGELPGFLLNS